MIDLQGGLCYLRFWRGRGGSSAGEGDGVGRVCTLTTGRVRGGGGAIRTGSRA